MDRDPDRARLVGDRAGHRLADPPGRVGGELEALAVVELLDRADQAEVALLDQVEQVQAAAHVALGDGHDQAQVGLDQRVLGVLVAALDQLREPHLVARAEQRDRADLLQVGADGVGRGDSASDPARPIRVVEAERARRGSRAPAGAWSSSPIRRGDRLGHFDGARTARAGGRTPRPRPAARISRSSRRRSSSRKPISSAVSLAGSVEARITISLTTCATAGLRR